MSEAPQDGNGQAKRRVSPHEEGAAPNEKTPNECRGPKEPDTERLYRFEEGRRTKRVVELEDPSLDVLCHRLELPASGIKIFRDDLVSFVRHVVLNIEWYRTAGEEEDGRRRRFFWLSLALSFLIPVLIAAIEWASDGGYRFALGAGILSGIVAVQRALSSWLQRRNVGELFREASSNLKDILYDLEDDWAGRVSDVCERTYDIHAEAFGDALTNGVLRARKIVADERARYFELSAPPPISLSARTAAVSKPGSEFADTRAGTSRFRFSTDFSADEVDLVRRNHTMAESGVGGCVDIDERQKMALRDAYSRSIFHWKFEHEKTLGIAQIPGSSIGLNMTLLKGLGEPELAQTLIHEMMHCAGFRHRDLEEGDAPGDGGGYYGSPPLLAELCIADMQSDTLGPVPSVKAASRLVQGACERALA